MKRVMLCSSCCALPSTPEGLISIWVWVDTNVLHWQTYSRASLRPKPPQTYQTRTYPSWLSRALRSGSTLHWLALSFAELAHQIETAEREIAEGAGQIPSGTKPKDFHSAKLC